jgi:PAS domain S-box-containing protein
METMGSASTSTLDGLLLDGTLLDGLPLAAAIHDRDGALLRCNRRAGEFLRDPPAGTAEQRAHVLRSGETVAAAPTVLARANGGAVAGRVTIAPLRDAEGAIVATISFFEAAPEARAAAPTDLEALLAALPVPIYTADTAGRITFCNEAAAALAGRRPTLGEDKWGVTWRLYRPDGTPLPHDQRPMALALRERRPVRGEVALLERPDGTRIPVAPCPTPLFDGSGMLVGAVNILVDLGPQVATEAELRRINETLEERVAERTRALIAEMEERRLVEAQLHELQKSEAVGQLTSGVAHDFNNLLTAIMSSLDLIDLRTKDESVRRHTANALRAAKRGASITHQLLAFSRKQHLEPSAIDLNRLLTGMGDLLQHTLGGTIKIEFALAPGLWPALIDPNQIESVILNLAINARDAMPDGGTLTVATDNERRSASSGGIAPGDYVKISVIDSGVGMSDEVKARAFDPFFTTKDIGEGSGLGLSQVYGIARQSGGGVEIDSTPGAGTAVHLFLPRARGGLGPHPLEGRAVFPAAGGRRERVLVVDDDEDVRSAIAECLRHLGYRITIATSGGAALDALAGTSFDLVVMDFAMPGMNGVEAGRMIRARWPELPILFISGHAETPTLAEEITQQSLLRKPFVSAELEARIRRLLPERRGYVERLRSEAG